ncbi:MAG: DUF1275 domain-containing protein [Alphaproteobacteria bacterium]|nr:DUF1275 domain-containing protein [Alphaproteobacteria bacterium]
MAIWAALLALIAGYVDAICYWCVGPAFAANMTGNLVWVGIAAAGAEWRRALSIGSVILAFLLGIVAARLLVRAHRSPRTAFLVEAVLIALAATGELGAAAIPLLAAAMALQNEAGVHGVVAVNVAFITGDLQQFGERLVAETVPSERAPTDNRGRVILVILAFYAAGAAVGTWASGLAASALLGPAAVLALGAALPPRWTRLSPSKG